MTLCAPSWLLWLPGAITHDRNHAFTREYLDGELQDYDVAGEYIDTSNRLAATIGAVDAHSCIIRALEADYDDYPIVECAPNPRDPLLRIP
jgi:hypothetical protein